MIVVTGGEGFIGKNLVQELKKQGHLDVVVLDIKNQCLDLLHFWLLRNAREIECVFHLGAITDTTETDTNKFYDFNVSSSIFVWSVCTKYKIPLIYASSAATYGNGEEGFDDEKNISNLQPLNPYGWSKQQFDMWVKTEVEQPLYWYGLKFFNVYGFGEAHKEKMASTILHFYAQALTSKKGATVNLFKSYNPDYKDGEQLRDFIYVDDVVNIMLFFYEKKPESGIYNVGTGKARTFNDVAKAIFKLHYMGDGVINYIDMPDSIKNQYQYFTEAKINKLRKAGYTAEFNMLEEGIEKYLYKLSHEDW